MGTDAGKEQGHWQILYFLIIKAFQYSIKILILPPLSYKKKKRPAKFSVENLIGRFDLSCLCHFIQLRQMLFLLLR